ncbi:hypothetical protein L1283_001966 [Sphingobacterium sp. HSC-15S19]
MPSLHPLSKFILPIKNSHSYTQIDCFTKNPLPNFLPHITPSLHPSLCLNHIETGNFSKSTISLHLRRPVFHTTFVLQRTRK